MHIRGHSLQECDSVTRQTLLCGHLHLVAAAAAKSLQSCPTVCKPIDGSPPGSPFPGILQARSLEWVAISFSNAWEWKVKVESLSSVWLLATPWIVAHQAPPSMGFSRQEYWSGVPLPSPSFGYLCYLIGTSTMWSQWHNWKVWRNSTKCNSHSLICNHSIASHFSVMPLWSHCTCAY